MLWLVFGLLSALFQGISSVLSKKELFHKHAMEFATLRGMFVAVFSLVLLFFLKSDVSLGMIGWIYLASWNLTILMLIRAKAMRHLDISVFSPMTNMSPAILIVIAFLVLGETLLPSQLFGIFLIMVGAYILEVDHNFKNILDPLKKMFTNKYHLFAVSTLFLMSFGAVIDKFMITNYITPLVYLCYLWIFNGVNIIIIDFIQFRLKDVKKDLREGSWMIMFIALISMASNVFYMLAVSLQMVSLVIPIKRLATFFSTLVGGKLFHEKGLKLKIIACLIMILGTYFISL